MKKLISLIGAGALLLSVATPTFAWWWGGSQDTAIVNNGATSYANTGWNGQGNLAVVDGRGVGDVAVDGNNRMVTGDATAYAGALVVANTHVGCGNCASGGRGHRDFALVGNNATANADTGDNGQGNTALVGGGLDASGQGGHGEHGSSDVTVGGNNTIRTGSADSTARAWTIVNTHVGF